MRCCVCRDAQKTVKDVSNFDREFTSEAPKLTPTDKLFIMNLDQTEFAGFSYVNPECLTDKLFIMNLDQTEFAGFSYVNPEFVVTV